MLKAIIIDDEIGGVEALRSLLAENCKELSVIGAETDPVKAIDQVRKLKPDLVFLDIQMPTMSGFELLERLKDAEFYVIFTTAYDQYAVKAFRHNAIDYLLKPIIISELIAAVDKVISYSENNSKKASIERLREKIQGVLGGQKLAIPSMNDIVYIDTDQINRLESDSNYTNIIMVTGKKYNSSKTLKEYESLLNPDLFFRVFKTHIINLRHVERYIKGDGGYIVMTDGTKVPVSREKRQALLDLMAQA
jgi:two-component system LytT family response regulator